MRTFGLCAAIALLSWAIVGGFIGCSNEKQQITPPVVGPAAGSGPMGGGDTQSLQLTASPSQTLTTIGEEQGTITVTALVENSIGQPMPDGTPVYWSTTQGSIAPTTGTSSNGAAEATVTFPKAFEGCTTVTAHSGDVTATIKLCVSNVEATPTPSKTFIVNTDKSTIDTTAGEKATITAQAQTNGSPDVGLQVNFSVSGPGLLSSSAALTDAGGVATVIVTANNTSTTSTSQTATITVTSADGRSGTIQITITN